MVAVSTGEVKKVALQCLQKQDQKGKQRHTWTSSSPGERGSLLERSIGCALIGFKTSLHHPLPFLAFWVNCLILILVTFSLNPSLQDLFSLEVSPAGLGEPNHNSWMRLWFCFPISIPHRSFVGPSCLRMPTAEEWHSQTLRSATLSTKVCLIC